uniref:Uncharacterized protein n=1 Tax=Sphaerodactylus townsendi TaxID=933632 RepID=A0ACB8F6K3_9SAUR
MCDMLGVTDIWRKVNETSREYTYYSKQYNTRSRLDMCLGTKDLSIRTKNINIEVKVFSDHFPILWELKGEQNSFHWRMNEYLLTKKKLYKKAVKKWKSF